MGGGGETGIDALARASGRKPATRGCLFRFGEREGKALGVPAHEEMEAVSFRQPPSGTKTAPLQRRDAAGRPARGAVGQRASGKERGESASGSVPKCRPLRRVYAVSVRLRKFPLRLGCS